MPAIKFSPISLKPKLATQEQIKKAKEQIAEEKKENSEKGQNGSSNQ